MSILWSLVVLTLVVMAFKVRQHLKRLERAEFIRSYSFPQGLLAKLAEKRPGFTLKEQQLVSRGLRQFFICNLMARGEFLSMPSYAVDDLWHEFILFTKHYGAFCNRAFGKFLHHSPAVVLSSQKVADQGLRRTWWFARKDETINPVKPTRLPLLFALDSKLNLADGFHYVPNCNNYKSKNNGHSSAVNCATDFGGRSADGSSGSDGFGDLGFSSADSGGSSCGGSRCGGGDGD